jgi:hypothetical protein
VFVSHRPCREPAPSTHVWGLRRTSCYSERSFLRCFRLGRGITSVCCVRAEQNQQAPRAYPGRRPRSTLLHSTRTTKAKTKTKTGHRAFYLRETACRIPNTEGSCISADPLTISRRIHHACITVISGIRLVHACSLASLPPPY